MMTGTNQTEQGDNGRTAGAQLAAETKTKNFVKDCPFRNEKLFDFCDGIPGNFLCNNESCWTIGEVLDNKDVERIAYLSPTEFARAITLADTKIVVRLVDAYLAQQNRPAG